MKQCCITIQYSSQKLATIKQLIAFKPFYALIDSSFWYATINLEWSIVYIEGSYVFLSLKNNTQAPLLLILFNDIAFLETIVLVNSVDPDEMLRNAAFHLGLHCLPSTHLGVTSLSIQRASREFEISS